MYSIEVSIIVCIYNAQEYLMDALEKLAAQTFSNFEVIIVDDGSTDGSSQMIDQYCNEHERFKAVHISHNGLFNARLEGIRKAKGSYIGFCDSDDLPEPNMLEKMYRIAIETGADITLCGYVREEMETGRVLSREMLKWERRAYLMAEEAYILPVINPAVWNKLIRREILQSCIRFETPPRILDDVMFICSLYPFVHSVAFVPEVLYHFRIHKGSLFSNVFTDDMEILRKDMLLTRQYVSEHAHNPEILMVCDSIAFIHFGLSLVIRQVQCGEMIASCVRDARAYLERFFPGYKKTGIGLWWNLRHHCLLLKPLLARWFFCAHLMQPFLMVYNFVTQKLKIEIKW